MYYEDYSDVNNAIAREKQLKNWKREWKIKLIYEMNPELKDIAEGWWWEVRVWLRMDFIPKLNIMP